MRSVLLYLLLIMGVSVLHAQHDTMYIMKNGLIVGKYNINTEIDSIIFYKPAIQEPTSGTFTDSRDGNIYKWVKIGNQIWLAENLKYLPDVVGPETGSETTPYYYVYDYNGTVAADAKSSNNYQIYGVLYNWPAAINACPSGWHLPSDDEWAQLIEFLGGSSIAGGKLKESGTAHWQAPNTDATNESLFTALPGGERNFNSVFAGIGQVGSWWSSTEFSSSSAWFRYMFYNYGGVSRNNPSKESGLSVRCVKD